MKRCLAFPVSKKEKSAFLHYSYFTSVLPLYPAVKIEAKNVRITASMITVPEPMIVPSSYSRNVQNIHISKYTLIESDCE